MDEKRLLVIENIRKALEDGDTFRKVEIGDPTVTEDGVKKVIVPFDNLKRKPFNKIKAELAVRIGRRLTARINENTEIVGLENILCVSGGAIITVNHFNIIDNTVIRYLAMKCGREKGLHIVVQESNIFMKGFFGFLMKNGYTLPVSSNLRYMQRNLKPALAEILGRGDTVLIYPEQEMWFNYKKPRPLREGAYQFACENNVPIIPCFIEMAELDGEGEDGFKRVKHILHVMPPLYPDAELDKREARRALMERDMELKIACYESSYGIKYDNTFIPERDIAGYNRKK